MRKTLMSIYLILTTLSSNAQYLDESFADNGVLNMPHDTYAYGGNDQLTAIAQDRQGFIYATGLGYKLIKFDINGKVDSSFLQYGRFEGLPYKTYQTPYDIELQTDGKILIAGVLGEVVNNTTGSDIVVIRLNVDGTYDSSFNGTGIVRLDISGAGKDYCNKITLQSDGKILLCGNIKSSDSGIVVRLNSDGILDKGFGQGGIVKNQFGDYQDDELDYIAVRPDKKIIVYGSTKQNGIKKEVLIQYTSSGVLDNSFGNNGIVIHEISGANPNPSDMALLPNGKVLTLNRFVFGNGSMVRYNVDGSIDTSFGKQGIAFITSDIGDVRPRQLEIDANNIIHIGGSIATANTEDYFYQRYLANGNVDSSYSPSGIVTSLSNNSDRINDMILQKDNKVLVAGYSRVDLSTRQYGMIRYSLFPTSVHHFKNVVREKFLVYPNPGSDKNINVLVPAKGVLKLYNSIGSLIWTENINAGEQRLNLPSDIPSGIYSIQFLNSKNSSADIVRLMIE